MANVCLIDMILTLESESEACQLYTDLLHRTGDATKRGEGVWTGSERYLFDAILNKSQNIVMISGWVKWGYSTEEIIMLLKFINEISVIKIAQICYKENSNLLMGEYIYDGKMLLQKFLPQEKFPQDNGRDDFETSIKSIYSTHQLIYTIGEIEL